MQRRFFFNLNVDPSTCLKLYQGKSSALLRAENGLKVSIPINRLREHISKDGLRGRFQLLVDQDLKIQLFTKIS